MLNYKLVPQIHANTIQTLHSLGILLAYTSIVVRTSYNTKKHISIEERSLKVKRFRVKLLVAMIVNLTWLRLFYTLAIFVLLSSYSLLEASVVFCLAWLDGLPCWCICLSSDSLPCLGVFFLFII